MCAAVPKAFAGEWWQRNGGRGKVENGVNADEESGSADVPVGIVGE